jgi:hypothetical protein
MFGVASGRTTGRLHRGSYPGGPGPVGEASRRRRPGRTTSRVRDVSGPRAVPREPTFTGFRSPCRSDRSRPVREEISFFPPKVSSPALNHVSRPCFIFGSAPFVDSFFMAGGRRGNGEQLHTLFWHYVEIFPPIMAKK